MAQTSQTLTKTAHSTSLNSSSSPGSPFALRVAWACSISTVSQVSDARKPRRAASAKKAHLPMDPMALNKSLWLTFGLGYITFKQFSGFTPWAKEMATMTDGEMCDIFDVNWCEISIPENTNFTYSNRRLQVLKSTEFQFQHGFDQINPWEGRSSVCGPRRFR